MAQSTSMYFKIALLMTVLVVCVITSSFADPDDSKFSLKNLVRNRRDSNCKLPKNVNKEVAFDCRVPHQRNGNNICCAGYTCKCGIQLSYYGIPAGRCQCIAD